MSENDFANDRASLYCPKKVLLQQILIIFPM